MKFYFLLSKIPFLRNSYPRKFLFIAFLGIHIPLIGLITAIIFTREQFSPLAIILFTLILTLVATLITLIVIRKLIKPITLASKALVNYRTNRTLPDLPLHIQDEAGLLLANIQKTINENESYLNQKQDMVYLLTHDIRNFASQPIALASFIIEEENVSLRNEYASLIIDSANQQVAFLQAFITLLNEEDEILNAVITKKTISLKSVIKRLETELELQLKEKKITLLVQCKMDEVILNINEILFTRLLFNLIGNAIKFSNAGSEIILDVSSSNGFIKIQVKDSGIGFDNSKKQLLFDKFTSMGRAGTNNEISTGIGLYLCNQIARKFKGSIDAHSDGENKGATFTVAFPML